MKRTIMLVACASAVALMLAGCALSPSAPTAGTSPSSGSGTAAETPAAPSAATSEAASPAAGTTAPDTGKPVATLAKFNQVKKGMKLSEVETIMGGPGMVITEGSSGDIKVAQYAWYGTDSGTAMTVSFLNGAVSATIQRGLK
ncbi:MAG: hypothetical protein WCJ13_00385 [Coriobacteriia bacterium]